MTLSTVHSAKGLEWSAVLIIDLVQDRFPSRHALLNEDEYEEERRLLYVACTRAKDQLFLFAPASIYNRAAGGHEAAQISPFIHELPGNLYTEEREGYGGMLYTAPSRPSRILAAPEDREAGGAGEFSLSREKIFSAPAPAPQSRAARSAEDPQSPEGEKSVLSALPKNAALGLGYCRHRIFGRGKIVQHIPPDKYRVNFTGFGLKVIMADYLVLEEG